MHEITHSFDVYSAYKPKRKKAVYEMSTLCTIATYILKES